jgi:hypothetical protein
MGMTPYHFGADFADYILQCKNLLFLRYLGMQHYLQKDIPQFLPHILCISCFIVNADGGYQLRCLLHHTRFQTFMGLFPVPGAAILAP